MMTTDILHTIVAHKRTEIALQEEAMYLKTSHSAVGHFTVRRKPETGTGRIALGIIAEFKRRSPVERMIAPTGRPDCHRPRL